MNDLDRCSELFAARADIEDDLGVAFATEDSARADRDYQRLAILDRDIASFLEGGGLSAPPGALSRGLLTPSQPSWEKASGELILPGLGDVRWDRLTVKMINQFEKARYMFEAGELEELGGLLVETCETMQYAVGELHPDYTPWPFCEERDGSTRRTSDDE